MYKKGGATFLPRTWKYGWGTLPQFSMVPGRIGENGAEKAWKILKEHGASKLVSADFVTSKINTLIKITDSSGTIWFLEFGNNGNLECIYRNSLEYDPVYSEKEDH